MRVLFVCYLLSCCIGCAVLPGSSKSGAAPASVVVDENKIPGTVDRAWVEPMYDTVRVPAQIDPTNTYYRPSHQGVVEIRPERFDDVRYDNEKKQRQPAGGQ